MNRDAWGIMGPNQPDWHLNADEESPAWLHEATRLLEEIGTTVDTAEAQRKMIRVRDLHTENVPIILPGFCYHVWGASTQLGNVPRRNTTTDGYRGWSRPVFHEQLFFRDQ